MPEQDAVTKDLAMLVRRLIRRVKMNAPKDKVALQAENYLKRFNLSGTVLRGKQKKSRTQWRNGDVAIATAPPFAAASEDWESLKSVPYKIIISSEEPLQGATSIWVSAARKSDGKHGLFDVSSLKRRA